MLIIRHAVYDSRHVQWAYITTVLHGVLNKLYILVIGLEPPILNLGGNAVGGVMNPRVRGSPFLPDGRYEVSRLHGVSLPDCLGHRDHFFQFALLSLCNLE